MGQIVGLNAKCKRANLNALGSVPTPADGEYILVSSDNSMNAAGQGIFDCYIVGDGKTAASELTVKYLTVYGATVLKEPTNSGVFLYTNYAIGTTIDLTNFGGNPSFNCYILSLPENTSAVNITGTGGSAGRLWAFLDENNVLLSVADAGATLSSTSPNIPQGASKVVVNITGTGSVGITSGNDIGRIDSEILALDAKISSNAENIETVEETIGNPSGELVLTADDYCGMGWNGSRVASANSTINGFLVELTEGVNYTLNSKSYTRIIFSTRPTVGASAYIREVDYNFVAAEGEKWLLITVNKSSDTQVPQSIDYTATGLYSVIENIGKEDTTGVAWTSNADANKHIAELYINPDYYVSGLKFKALLVKKDDCTIWLCDSSDNVIANHSLNWSVPQSYPIMPYSELLFPINRNSDKQLIGYIKFIYTGTDYGVSSINYILDEEIVTDLNNSKTIKAVYENDSEGVLFGDSLISYPNTSRKVFVAYLTNRFKMHFWDAGCGGCTMAYRTAQGTDYYDSFTFVKLVDLFVTGVMDENQSASHDGEYAVAMKNLLSVNKSKRLFVINEYGINDYNTGVIAKGDYFVADNSTYDIDNLDKTTLLGAMSYGVARLFTYKPDIHYCQVTTAYVVSDRGFGYGDDVNSKGKFAEWCDSICENAIKLGVPYVKGVDIETGRNFFTNQMEGFNTVDGNHTNEFGAYRLAIAFAQVFERMM